MESNFNELEALRKDMALLKNKLDTQEIINEELIHRTVRTSLKGMSRDQLIWIFIALFGIPYCTWVFHGAGFSLAFTIATALFLAVCAVIMVFNRIKLNRIMDVSEKDLLSCAEELQKMKKQDMSRIKYSLGVVAVWLIWFYCEIFRMAQTSGNPEYFIGMGIGGLVGGLIGGFFGVRYFIKSQREMQENIDSIEAYKNN